MRLSESLKKQHGNLFEYITGDDDIKNFIEYTNVSDCSKESIQKACLTLIRESFIPAEGGTIDYDDLAKCMAEDIMNDDFFPEIVESVGKIKKSVDGDYTKGNSFRYVMNEADGTRRSIFDRGSDEVDSGLTKRDLLQRSKSSEKDGEFRLKDYHDKSFTNNNDTNVKRDNSNTNKQLNRKYEDSDEIFTVRYRKIYTSPSGYLAVVQKIGWDKQAGDAFRERFHVLHLPTRSDVGSIFSEQSNAINFVNIIDDMYDWSFTNPQDSDVDEEQVYIIANRQYGMGMFGKSMKKMV